MPLREFLNQNRADLVERCRLKVLKRPPPFPTWDEKNHGIPLFLGQLIEMLDLDADSNVFAVADDSAPKKTLSARVAVTATKHARALRERGLTVDQVVHDYGDVCQAVTELAYERNAQISISEFHTLNRLLDNAIAAAVTEHAQGRGSPQAPSISPS
jgi:hypothetical protein